MPSSDASLTCRIDWRPSRWCLAALALLGPAAAAGLLMSDLPHGLAWGLAPLVVVRGAWLAVREAGRVPVRVEFDARALRVDGVAATGARWDLRGPFAWLRVRVDGRWRCFAWAPDTLPPAEWRRLRLALPGHGASARAALVAP